MQDTVHALWSLLRAAVASELGRSQLTVPEAQLHQLCTVRLERRLGLDGHGLMYTLLT